MAAGLSAWMVQSCWLWLYGICVGELLVFALHVSWGRNIRLIEGNGNRAASWLVPAQTARPRPPLMFLKSNSFGHVNLGPSSGPQRECSIFNFLSNFYTILYHSRKKKLLHVIKITKERRSCVRSAFWGFRLYGDWQRDQWICSTYFPYGLSYWWNSPPSLPPLHLQNPEETYKPEDV